MILGAANGAPAEVKDRRCYECGLTDDRQAKIFRKQTQTKQSTRLLLGIQNRKNTVTDARKRTAVILIMQIYFQLRLA